MTAERYFKTMSGSVWHIQDGSVREGGWLRALCGIEEVEEVAVTVLPAGSIRRICKRCARLEAQGDA